MNQYYVYKHINPKTLKVFYIGIGCKHRVIEGGRLRNKKWQREVYEAGGFLFEFVVKDVSKEEALREERRLINEYGLDNLANIVGEEGNSTAFKKGLTPWNKGLTGAQACVYKPLICEGIQYDSVDECIASLKIGRTTFYRRIKKGDLKIEYVSKNHSYQ